MMYEFWMDISYSVQLVAACLIFLIPAQKRGHSVPRILCGMCVFAGLSLLIESSGLGKELGIHTVFYWGFYMAASVLFSWFVLAGTWLQAVYCAVCACAVQHAAFDGCRIYEILSGKQDGMLVLIYGVVYAASYYFFARKLPQNGRFPASKSSVFPIVTIVFLAWILSILEESGLPVFQAAAGHRIIYRVIDVLCCFYVLWVQISQKERMRIARELDGINFAWQQQSRQYYITQETIESINRKCHDLKHQIIGLKYRNADPENNSYFEELENDLMIYDTAVQTGNRALDIVLMEKGLFCRNHDIQWTCMADGACLEFMAPEDIYAIFGNSLDNAIRAVMELEAKEMRVISVRVFAQNKLVLIQVQNYYTGEIKFENSLPVTTKENKNDHGYGLKSIRYAVEKYNGTLTVKAEDHIFMLQMVIPRE